MDIFEAAEVTYPSRTFQQDEEEQAIITSSSNLLPPIVMWNAQLRQQLYPEGLMPLCMIVATSRVACALLKHSFPYKKVLGTCVLADLPMSGNHIQPSLRDQSCLIYAYGDLMLVSCQYNMPPERASAFTKGLFKEICPKHVVILGSLASEQLRGIQEDCEPSQEPLVYMLTTRKQTSDRKLPIPYLSSGSIVSGLPAATLSYCQMRSMSADLLVTVDMVPSIIPMALKPLALAAAVLVGKHISGGKVVAELSSSASLRAAREDLEKAYGGVWQNPGSIFA